MAPGVPVEYPTGSSFTLSGQFPHFGILTSGTALHQGFGQRFTSEQVHLAARVTTRTV
jgi:hypothetical protein